MILEIEDMTVLKMLEVLRLTPIYTLLGSEFQDELPEGFKPWKWTGSEKDHADKAHDAYMVLLRAAEKAKGINREGGPE